MLIMMFMKDAYLEFSSGEMFFVCLFFVVAVVALFSGKPKTISL